MLGRRVVPFFGIAVGSCLALDARAAAAAETGQPEPAESSQAIEHAKLNTADASPVDPGHIELELGGSGTWARRATARAMRMDGDRCGNRPSDSR